MNRRSRSTAAFTLVELLVVIGIIGALIGIILPATMSAVDTSRLIRCEANMRQLSVAILAYAAGNQHHLPPNYTSPAPGRYWCDKQVIGSEMGSANGSTAAAVSGGVMVCPADGNAARSYSMNIWASSIVDQPVRQNAPPGFALWPVTPVDSSRLILLVESWAISGSQGATFAPETVGDRGTTAGVLLGGGSGVNMNTPWDGPVSSEVNYSRHRGSGGFGQKVANQGRTNLAYLDGHVALRSNAELVDASGKSTGNSIWCPKEMP